MTFAYRSASYLLTIPLVTYFMVPVIPNLRHLVRNLPARWPASRCGAGLVSGEARPETPMEGETSALSLRGGEGGGGGFIAHSMG
jgi:hypothetical protein